MYAIKTMKDDEVALPTVAEARAELDAHTATCPGSHFECYGNLEKERARLAWIEHKHLLQTQLEVAREAERMEAQRWTITWEKGARPESDEYIVRTAPRSMRLKDEVERKTYRPKHAKVERKLSTNPEAVRRRLRRLRGSL